MFVFQMSVPAIPASGKKNGKVKFDTDSLYILLNEIAGRSGYWANQKYPQEVAQGAFEVAQMVEKTLRLGSVEVAKENIDALMKQIDIKFGGKSVQMTIDGMKSETRISDFFKTVIEAAAEPPKKTKEKKATPKEEKKKPAANSKTRIVEAQTGFFEKKIYS